LHKCLFSRCNFITNRIFAILTIPEVTTTIPTDIQINSATCGGNVTNDGNSIVTARGVCWNTAENPTLHENLGFTTDESGMGIFTSNLINLDDNTNYYITAYATNEKGTAYGSVKNFTTTEITLPNVTTTVPTNIQSNSVTCGGIVIDDGNSTIITRGVCWNSTGNPTLEDNLGHTIDGSGIGEFSSNLLDLTANTTYYTVAYATNEKGTSYGLGIEFLTKLQCGQLTIVYGSKVYHTVQIGNQCWLKENLNIGDRINNNQEM